MVRPVIFISYSHKDEKEKEQLVSHLKVLESSGFIELWVDDRIKGGADWEGEIKQAISEARVVVLLISAHFLTSEFILGKEVPKFLKRRQSEGLTVFPVIAKACDWESFDWLAEMNVRPKNGIPVWSGSADQIDERLAAITREIRNIVNKKEIPPPPPKSILKEIFQTISRNKAIWWIIIGVFIIALGGTIYTFYGSTPDPTSTVPTATKVTFVPIVTHTPTPTFTRMPTNRHYID